MEELKSHFKEVNVRVGQPAWNREGPVQRTGTMQATASCFNPDQDASPREVRAQSRDPGLFIP